MSVPSHSHSTARFREPLAAKVPEITAMFWVIKILTTGMGEATSDFLIKVNILLGGVVGLAAFALALWWQFRVRRYIAVVYWLAVAMVALATVFGISICVIAAFTGLAIGDEESVQAFGLIWLFPLTFLSSAFVPISSMPGWLQAFANNQPVTYVINTMRALALGGPIQADLWKSLVWLAGILLVFIPLAVRAYKRAS